MGDLGHEGLPDSRIRGGIHRAGGVIQDQHLGLLEQGPGNTKALPLAAGYVGTALFDVGIIAFRERADKAIRLGHLAGLLDLLLGRIGVAPAQVFLDGAGKQHVLLQHHAHGFAQGLQVVFPYVLAAQLYRALRYIVQPGDQLHQGRFTCARPADDPHRCPGGYMQIDVLEAHFFGFLRIAEGHILKINRTIHRLLEGLRPRQGGVGNVALFIQYFCNTLGAGPGDGDHHHDHGQHHQAGEDLDGISHHGHQLAGGHGAPYDKARAQPAGAQHTSI